MEFLSILKTIKYTGFITLVLTTPTFCLTFLGQLPKSISSDVSLTCWVPHTTFITMRLFSQAHKVCNKELYNYYAKDMQWWGVRDNDSKCQLVLFWLCSSLESFSWPWLGSIERPLLVLF